MIKLFESIFNTLQVVKEMTDKYNQSISNMSVVRTMECAFNIEDKFLSLMIAEAEKQIARTDFDENEIRDIADNVYQIKISQAQVFDSKEKIDLLDIKKYMLVRGFQKN